MTITGLAQCARKELNRAKKRTPVYSVLMSITNTQQLFLSTTSKNVFKIRLSSSRYLSLKNDANLVWARLCDNKTSEILYMWLAICVQTLQITEDITALLMSTLICSPNVLRKKFENYYQNVFHSNWMDGVLATHHTFISLLISQKIQEGHSTDLLGFALIGEGASESAHGYYDFFQFMFEEVC